MPFALIGVALLVIVVLAIMMVRRGRGLHANGLDLGAVSTRWLSEVRRDEPWSRS